MTTVTWEEVRAHSDGKTKWIVINGAAYDITRFANKHPGGKSLINNYAGEDATDAWRAFHIDLNKVKKYMNAFYVGEVSDYQDQLTEDQVDFRKLRDLIETKGLLKPNPLFYILFLAHLFALEAMSLAIFYYFGVSWPTYIIVSCLLTTLQAQAGWNQHDYGHLSVFPSSSLNHAMHHFVIGHIKAASSNWWNYRHFRHHAKPNVAVKDPDITMPYFMLFGSVFPVEWGKKKRGFMPYNYQHNYFLITLPPLLLPIYFHYVNIVHVIKNRCFIDIFCTITFFMRHFYCYGPFLGYGGAFGLYMFVRFLESFWFTWVTQMNHIPMKHNRDLRQTWLHLQLDATCNIEGGWFNDWFTGHLNYQIEHHLFPTMPRHNYYKVAPLVKELCEKHGINYTKKTLLQGFIDIYLSLKKSGKLWYDAYNEI